MSDKMVIPVHLGETTRQHVTDNGVPDGEIARIKDENIFLVGKGGTEPPAEYLDKEAVLNLIGNISIAGEFNPSKEGGYSKNDIVRFETLYYESLNNGNVLPVDSAEWKEGVTLDALLSGKYITKAELLAILEEREAGVGAGLTAQLDSGLIVTGYTLAVTGSSVTLSFSGASSAFSGVAITNYEVTLPDGSVVNRTEHTVVVNISGSIDDVNTIGVIPIDGLGNRYAGKLHTVSITANNPPSVDNATVANFPSSIMQNSSAEFSVSGATDADGDTVTYKTIASNNIITFDVGLGATEGQTVTLAAGVTDADVDITVSIYAVDSNNAETLVQSTTITVKAIVVLPADTVIAGGKVDADGMGITWDTPGIHNFIVPEGITHVSVVVISSGRPSSFSGNGGSRGGKGGSLAYANFELIPGQNRTVTVGEGEVGAVGGAGFNSSSFSELITTNGEESFGANGGSLGGNGGRNDPKFGAGWHCGGGGGGGGCGGYKEGSLTAGNGGYCGASTGTLGIPGEFGGGNGGNGRCACSSGYQGFGAKIDLSGEDNTYGAGGAGRNADNSSVTAESKHNGGSGVVRIIWGRPSFPEYLGIDVS